MKEFYDINSFSAYLVKKRLSALLIVILAVAGVSLSRFVDLYGAYKNQAATKQTTQAEETAATTSEPMWCRAGVIIYIPPQFKTVDGQQVDMADTIVSAYLANWMNTDTITALEDKYFERAKEIGLARNKQFYQYGYILEKESKAPYTYYDFQNQFFYGKINIIQMADFELTKNHVLVGFRDSDEKLAREVIKDYETMMHTFLTEELGEYTYQVVDYPVCYELPQPTTGAAPYRYVTGATDTAAASLSSVLKQTIKGAVWGALLGIVLAVILLFLSYMLRTKLVLVRDARELSEDFYGVWYRKKGNAWSRWWARFANRREGNAAVFTEGRDAAAIIHNDIRDKVKKDGAVKILVSGCGRKADIDVFAGLLNESAKEEHAQVTYIPCADISTSLETIRACETSEGVVLVESAKKSMLNAIQKERHSFEQYGDRIYGLLMAE